MRHECSKSYVFLKQNTICVDVALDRQHIRSYSLIIKLKILPAAGSKGFIVHVLFLMHECVCFLFSGPPPTLAAARLSHTGPSWADRVKCTQSVPSSSQPTTAPVEKLGKNSPAQTQNVL